jgi:hypothetical protein
VLAVRNAIAIALIMNRTLVLNDFYPHYLDAKADDSVLDSSYRFENVLEITKIAREIGLRTIGIEEFAEKFMGKSIDAPLVLHKQAYMEMLRKRLVPEDLKGKIVFNFTRKHAFKPLQFSSKVVHKLLAELNLDEQVVVFGLFNPITFPAESPGEQMDLVHKFGSVRIHSFYRNIALNWIKDNIPEEHRSCWACAHIRPYPDHQSCHDGWGSDMNINPKSCARKMPKPSYFKRKVSNISSICSGKSDTPVVVAYLPSMNQKNLYALVKDWNYIMFYKSQEFRSIENENGVQSIDANDSSIDKQIRSNFERSFVEQSICIHSPYFIGTPVSSWTDTVILDRNNHES